MEITIDYQKTMNKWGENLIPLLNKKSISRRRCLFLSRCRGKFCNKFISTQWFIFHFPTVKKFLIYFEDSGLKIWKTKKWKKVSRGSPVGSRKIEFHEHVFNFIPALELQNWYLRINLSLKKYKRIDFKVFLKYLSKHRRYCRIKSVFI